MKAIEKNFFQWEIAVSDYRFQRRVQSGDYNVVGVNSYAEGETPKPAILKINPEVQRRQVGRRLVRATRDQAKARAALAALREASRGSDNLMPLIIDCVKAYCTEGEICDVWRDIYGEYREESIY